MMAIKNCQKYQRIINKFKKYTQLGKFPQIIFRKNAITF